VERGRPPGKLQLIRAGDKVTATLRKSKKTLSQRTISVCQRNASIRFGSRLHAEILAASEVYAAARQRIYLADLQTA